MKNELNMFCGGQPGTEDILDNRQPLLAVVKLLRGEGYAQPVISGCLLLLLGARVTLSSLWKCCCRSLWKCCCR